MIDLKTTYAGLNLENPLIVSSSGLSDSVDKVSRLAEFGPGAIVLKSLFQEQIMAESGMITDDSAYPEALDYIMNYTRSHALGQYLSLIEQSKKNIAQPVIASINCVSSAEWIDFAVQIEHAGADALELNMFLLPVAMDASAKMEQVYLDILQKVVGRLRIPIIVKLSPYFTNLNYLVQQLFNVGARGVVLFNRLYEPDIDINQMKMTTADVLSTPSDLRHTLRWVSLVSDPDRKLDISASTGVHDAAAMVKLLLAGASTVQVCSLLYRNGPESIRTLVQGLEIWMKKRNYQQISDFRGILGYRNLDDPQTWERVQFMRYYAGRD